MTLITIKDLSYRYEDGTNALNQVSFQVRTGERIALVGANGAGKSTLLQHLNGLLLPQHGCVTIGEQTVSRRTVAAIRRRVGMVFQNGDDQLFMPTVLDDVCFGPLNQGLDTDQARQRALQALQQVGMADACHKAPFQLSEGEKRRVAIAGVIASRPEILVLDEPGAGLDPWARQQLIELLQQLDQTLLIASHDMELVRTLCKRALVLINGSLSADGPADEVLSDDYLHRYAPHRWTP